MEKEIKVNLKELIRFIQENPELPKTTVEALAVSEALKIMDMKNTLQSSISRTFALMVVFME